jgi:Mce-associated membrane protein
MSTTSKTAAAETTATDDSLAAESETDEVVDARRAAELADEPEEADDELDSDVAASGDQTWRRLRWGRAIAFGLLPAILLLAAAAAGYLKWQDATARDADLARGASVQAAKDATVSMLSYQPDTVDRDLEAARKLLTGDFQNSYTSLTHDVVIPGAKQKRISAVATVPAAASVSASPRHAAVVVFVDQTVVVGSDAPSDTASTVRVTLDKVGDHWLIAGFDPI